MELSSSPFGPGIPQARSRGLGEPDGESRDSAAAPDVAAVDGSRFSFSGLVSGCRLIMCRLI